MTAQGTRRAPGRPGAGPHWESGRKSGVGRACNFFSRVWFTVGEGILNELYYPRPDQPCVKDAGFLIADGKSFVSEERRDTTSEVQWAAPGVPALRLINTHRGGAYRIHKEIVADPERDVILQRTRFEVLRGPSTDYRIYILLAPHLGDEGVHNTARSGSYKGAPMLFAKSRLAALALACSTGWKDRSVGFAGASDGWHDLTRHKSMHWHYDLAEDGNVVLTGEIQAGEDGSFILAIGFGERECEAAFAARASLGCGFDRAWSRYIEEWKPWQKSILSLDEGEGPGRIFRHSTALLRAHEAVDQPGGRVASLSVPWGEAREHQEAAGYHAVWARDCAQSALGLLACGAQADVRRTLDYLGQVQEADGHWPQVMWLDGETYWKAIQIDSIAAPLILYEIVRQEGLFDAGHPAARHWPMVRKAAEFICKNGPVSQQDRWERNSGYSVYTLSLAIAGLVIAGQAAHENGEKNLASSFLETADAWNAQVENWTYCEGSDLARSLGLRGYYCRIVPADDDGHPCFDRNIPMGNDRIKNVQAREMVSPDVWALVRYGLRRPDDPRIAETTAAIDATLRTKTPEGPVWHRYNHDGYGETENGDPFRQAGVGRGWPLLVGERAHYELALGNEKEALRLVKTMENLADAVGLLPEQVWDTADIPDKGLYLGKATGSARPLAWAHAEYVQLVRSLRDHRVFSCPRIVSQRYFG